MKKEKKKILKSRFVVEIPAELESKLKNEAVRENRSRNAQIAQVLKERYCREELALAN